MHPIKNDKNKYRTRESLSSPPKSMVANQPVRKEFRFEIDGHYLVRQPKPTSQLTD